MHPLGTILILTRRLQAGGGLEIQLVVAAEQLALKGWEVTVAYEVDGDLYERWRGFATCIRTTLSTDSVRNLAEASTFVYIWEPDVAVALVVLLREHRSVIHLQFPSDHLRSGMRRLLKGKFRNSIERELFGKRTKSHFIATSNFTAKQWLSGGIPRSRMQVVLNCIDPKRFAAETPSRSSARGLCGVESTGVVLGFVGRIDPRKGVGVALDVQRRLSMSHQTTLVLIGGPTDGHGEAGTKYLESLRASSGSDVVWLGRRSNIPELLPALDFLLVPSQWGEPFGLVAAEAMYCGVVPVVFRDGGLPEVLGAELADNAVDRTTDSMVARMQILLSNHSETLRCRNLGVERTRTLLAAARLGAELDIYFQQLLRRHTEVES